MPVKSHLQSAASARSSVRSDAKREAVCSDVVKSIATSAPESDTDAYGDLRVLTRRGWARVSCSPCLVYKDEINLYVRFERTPLSGFGNGKWNHFLRAETAVEDAKRLFTNLWPESETQLIQAQVFGAIGRLLEVRRTWQFDRQIFGPLADRFRLRVLDQPGQYSASLSIWAQPGTPSFAEQDEAAFWDIAAEFGISPLSLLRSIPVSVYGEAIS